jgi:hypothetical protein
MFWALAPVATLHPAGTSKVGHVGNEIELGMRILTIRSRTLQVSQK